jgi:predicted Zn-dependent protease with MMP-like domain
VRSPGGKEHARKRLYLAAHREVAAVRSALPPPVREHARKLPVLFEMTPRPSDLKSGIEPDTLGLFTGNSLADGHEATSVSPTEIVLYMENIWDYAGHDAATFREEIRRTYLHELGHYLGIDEDGLTDRDLD